MYTFIWPVFTLLFMTGFYTTPYVAVINFKPLNTNKRAETKPIKLLNPIHYRNQQP